MLTWPGRGLYVHSPRADSAYDAPQAEKNRGYTSREMGKPMVISHRTPALQRELGLGVSTMVSQFVLTQVMTHRRPEKPWLSMLGNSQG